METVRPREKQWLKFMQVYKCPLPRHPQTRKDGVCGARWARRALAVLKLWVCRFCPWTSFQLLESHCFHLQSEKKKKPSCRWKGSVKSFLSAYNRCSTSPAAGRRASHG